MPPRLPPAAYELVDVDLNTLAALQLFLGKSLSAADQTEQFIESVSGAGPAARPDAVVS